MHHMSHQQDVIFPQGSLFLVVKGWSPRKSSKEVQLDGQGGRSESSNDSRDDCITPDDVSISMMKPTRLSQPLEQDSLKRIGNTNTVPAEQPSKTRTDSNAGSTFQFVNATDPQCLKNPDLRKLVKSHVKRRSDRNKYQRASQKTAEGSSATSKPPTKTKTAQIISPGSIQSPPVASPVCTGSTAPYYGQGNFSLDMVPGYQNLVEYYLGVIAPSWYPLEKRLAYNPVKSGWFPLAFQDEILFRSVLFSAASHLSHEHGQSESKPAALVQPVFQHLNKRLRNTDSLTSTTIGVVSCLAMVEISLGNYDNWKIHMSAIKEMVRLRGGLQNLEEAIQIKITRADVEGATDCVVSPYLVPFKRSMPPTYSMLLSPNPLSSVDTIKCSLAHCITCKELQDISFELLRLSFAINHVLNNTETSLHPRALDEDFMELQHKLLLWENAKKTAFDEGFKLGALIYAKSVTRPINIVPNHTKALVQKLTDTLTSMHQNSAPKTLVIWLCLMGYIAVTPQSSQRAWFVNYLAAATSLDGELSTWEDIETLLAHMPWVRHIHETLFKQAWGEVQFVRSTPSSLDLRNPLESTLLS